MSFELRQRRESTPSPARESAIPTRPELRVEVVAESKVRGAVRQAQEHLLGLRQEDGHWCAELEGDTILESEYLMLLWFLGRRDDPRFEQGCRYLLSQQLDEGGWAIYPGGPPDPSPSVKAYFVLKLCGFDPQSEPMVRARDSIRQLGGIAACNSFTKIYLAMFGQWPWRKSPAVPPELILAPRWFPINIYEMSSWSRAIVVPLAILWAHRPYVETGIDLDELDTGDPPPRPGSNLRERFWFAFFRAADRGAKLADGLGLFAPTRRLALRRCERWTTTRLADSAGLGAIFPAIVNAAVALRLQGYDEDHPYVRSQLDELEKLEIFEPEPPCAESAVEGTADSEHRSERPSTAPPGSLRLQPCQSPVWDTALSLNALLESEIDPRCDEVQAAARWLLEREVRHPGDWQEKNRDPDVEPSGWCFEYANAFYPDCDDTAEILAVLGKLEMLDPEWEQRRRETLSRALRWQLSMQNRDGGWGAFDRECNRELLTYVPFADHNAMIDPSTVDVTSRTIEALVQHVGSDHPSVRRAVDFVVANQEPDGSWFGRWGSNYLYGTWLALCALVAAGHGRCEAVRRGVDWLLATQLEDGGWGETLASYVDPAMKGTGPSTAAQTAWAMMGLIAVARDGAEGASVDGDLGDDRSVAVRTAIERAVDHLLERRLEDGSWRDEQWTGTGFPAVFYLRYHYYDRYFPLQALAAADAFGVEGTDRSDDRGPDPERSA